MWKFESGRILLFQYIFDRTFLNLPHLNQRIIYIRKGFIIVSNSLLLKFLISFDDYTFLNLQLFLKKFNVNFTEILLIILENSPLRKGETLSKLSFIQPETFSTESFLDIEDNLIINFK